MENGCRLPRQPHIGQLNEVYSGYILNVCSCDVWELHMPSSNFPSGVLE